MTMPSELNLNQADIDRQLGDLAKKFDVLSGAEVRRAHSAALNKGASRIRTAVVRKSAPELGITQKLLRPRLAIRKSSARTLTSEVTGRLRGIPLIRLKAKEIDGGVQAGNYLVPDGFIAVPTKNPKFHHKHRREPGDALIGKAQVFKRIGRGAYPLKAQKLEISPAVQRQMRAEADRIMRSDMRKLLAQEYKFRVLRKAGIA